MPPISPTRMNTGSYKNDGGGGAAAATVTSMSIESTGRSLSSSSVKFPPKPPAALSTLVSSIYNGNASDDASKRAGTWGSSTILLVTSCFGVSVLSVPWAIAQCGWAMSGIGLVVCGILTQWGADMLMACATKLAKGRDVAVTLKHVAKRANPNVFVTALPEVSKMEEGRGEEKGMGMEGSLLLASP